MTQTKAELLQTKHQGELRLGDADSSKSVGFKAPATVSTDVIWTLPAADGTANYLLKTDGSGNLGWVADSTTDSTKMPLAGGTFTGDVTFDGATAGRDIVFDRSDNALEFADDAKAIFGASGDLQVYHDSGGDSFISESGGGALILRGDGLQLQRPNGNLYLKCIAGSRTELYHNNVKTFQTDANGASIFGPEGGDALIFLQADEGDDNADIWRIKADTSGNFKIGNLSTGSFVDGLTLDGSNNDVTVNVGTNKNILFSGSIGEIGNVTGFQAVNDAQSANTSFGIRANDIRFATGSSERMRIDSSGRVIIGEDSAITTSSNRLFQVVGDTNGGGVIALGRNQTTLTNQSLGGIEFYGNDPGSAFTRTAAIFCEAAAEWSSNDCPSKLIFRTTPDGSTTNTTALTLDSSQNATFASAIYGPAKAVSALQLDLSTGNYFTKTISGNSTFTFVNPAASGTVTAFTLELTHSSGTVAWPSSVKFNNDTAPTLTTGKTHLFMFVTDDGGTRYRGSALVDYVN